jgi:hypothetical protein
MICSFRSFFRCVLLVGVGCMGFCWAAPSRAIFTEFKVGGDATTASIQGTVDSFRTALGNPNNANNPGPIAGGRREINWDGGGAVTATPVGTPMTTFQNRGATMTTPGTGFLQTPLGDPALTGLNATYSTEFAFFSTQRIFTPLGSNITDVTFNLPGNAAIPATVAGFGAVFSDVDRQDATKLEFFGLANNLLFTVPVPADSVGDAGLSFAGALANAGERVARVRITTGNSALGPTDQNGDNVDVVVMDDFLYPEPGAVPEPACIGLAMVGLMIGTAMRSRRRA